MKIVIAGLGLIGGSFAKALARAGGYEITAVEKDRKILAAAAEECVIIGQADEGALRAAELVFIALPPKAAADFLRENAPLFAGGALVMDACGVKQDICTLGSQLAARYGFSFIGGHPMAGRECSGYENSLADLFNGASFILTPEETAEPDWLEPLLRSAGFAEILRTTPAHHDRMIAYTSQLPHALACAYILDERSGAHSGYSAGSFRDVTRVAGVDESLWTELFLANAAELSGGIGLLRSHLQDIEDCLTRRDAEALREFLRRGRLKKEKTAP